MSRDEMVEQVVRAARNARLAPSGDRRARALLELWEAIDRLDGCPSPGEAFE